MASEQAMISIKPATRDRIFQYKRAGVSYDTIISAMVDAYEEKMNNSPACSCKNETGEDHNSCKCKEVIN